MKKHRKCDLTSILTSTGIRLMDICVLRLLNWLDFSDVQTIISYKDIKNYTEAR